MLSRFAKKVYFKDASEIVVEKNRDVVSYPD